MDLEPFPHSKVLQPTRYEPGRKPRYSFSQPRSRNGCYHCKSLRRKCSEEKPSCSRCVSLRLRCDYIVKLSWGGRSFRKSRFGACLDKNATKIATQKTGFVYGLHYSDVQSPGCSIDEEQGGTISPDKSDPLVSSVSTAGIETCLSQRAISVRCRELGATTMPLSHRFILDHFINSTSVFLSSHESFYHRIQSELIPMSLQTPYLLSAVLALACRSCRTQGVASVQGVNISTLISLFFLKSIKGLRRAISSSTERESLIATSLLLCLGEIYAGGVQSKAWSVHLEGAKTLIAIEDYHARDAGKGQSKSLRLLNHLFLGISVQAALRSDLPCHSWLSLDSVLSGEHFVDEYLGFSTDLIPIFKSIGQAAQQFHGSCVFEGEGLLRKVNEIINRDKTHTPRLKPMIQSNMSDFGLYQFCLSNTAYQHAAKIHIYRRLLNQPSSSTEVQASAQKILDCAQKMIGGEGLRPWITMVMPIFTAGCEVQDSASRASASSHLFKLGMSIGAQNIHHVRKVMEGSWNCLSLDTDLPTMPIWSHDIVDARTDFITF